MKQKRGAYLWLVAAAVFAPAGCLNNERTGPPTLAVDLVAFAFTIEENTDRVAGSFYVGNVGGGTLNYAITSEQITGDPYQFISDGKIWLRATPTAGAVVRISDRIDIHIDTTDLIPGDYAGQFTVTVINPDAVVSQVIVTVDLTVTYVTSYFVNDQETSDDVYCNAPGSDDIDGRTPDTPMRTLQALFSIHKPGPGSTIYVDTGTYPQSTNLEFSTRHSGLPGEPIRIVGAPPDVTSGTRTWATVLERTSNGAGEYGVEIAGASHITFENLAFTGGRRGVMIQDGAEITFTNCAFTDNSADGLRAVRGSAVTLDSCLLENNAGPGASFFSVDGVAVTASTLQANGPVGVYAGGCTNLVLRRNRVSEHEVGMQLDGCTSPVVGDSLFYENRQSGIELIGGTTGAVLVNNTLYDNGPREVLIQDGSTGASLFNNILHAEGSGAFCLEVAADSQTGFQSDYNAVYPAFPAQAVRWGTDDYPSVVEWRGTGTGHDANSIRDEPLFVDASKGDFHQADDPMISPTIDAGFDAAPQLGDVDLDDNPRLVGSKIDIGAYEKQDSP